MRLRSKIILAILMTILVISFTNYISYSLAMDQKKEFGEYDLIYVSDTMTLSIFIIIMLMIIGVAVIVVTHILNKCNKTITKDIKDILYILNAVAIVLTINILLASAGILWF